MTSTNIPPDRSLCVTATVVRVAETISTSATISPIDGVTARQTTGRIAVRTAPTTKTITPIVCTLNAWRILHVANRAK